MNKWDKRFLRLAREVSTWSKDPSSKVGAVFVSPDRRDIILGYNGFARRHKDCPDRLSDRAQKYPRVIHAEMNGLLLGRRSVEGYTLYTWPFISCDRCAVHMTQAEIGRHVAPTPTPDQEERWGDSFKMSRQHFAEANIPVVEYDLAQFPID